MWFKNLTIYRIPANPALTAASLEEKFALKPLQECGNQDRTSRGWVAPKANGPMVHSTQRQLLIALGNEQKILPASVVNRFAKDRAAEIEERQGHPVGRKQMQELKEQITEELLPRAFSSQRTTLAWIDPVNGWLVVDTPSTAKGEEILETIGKTVDDFPIRLLKTVQSPVAAMTEWLSGKTSPDGFSIDRDLELSAGEEGKLRYVSHELEGDEIRAHIEAGKTATRLGMTWNDRISFVLTDTLQIRRLTFLDLIKEEAEGQAEGADQLFDINFTLMTGELAKLLDELIAALGGEMPG